MQKKPLVDENRYGYATGRVRALEAQLMDAGRLSRLFDARSAEDIARLMQESGYTVTDSEVGLERETTAVYSLVASLMPDREFDEALLIFNDFHNLKVVEKYLATWWPRRLQKPEEAFEMEPLAVQEAAADLSAIEIPSVNEPVIFTAIESMMASPSLVEPERLFRAIRDRQPELIPPWLYQAAVSAAAAMQARYNIAEIEQVLDRTAYAEALQRARRLGNKFFLDYLYLRADLTNLDLLLRVRTLRAGRRLLDHSLLPGGSLSRETLLAWCDTESESIVTALAASRFALLAQFYMNAGDRGTATQFSRTEDNMMLEFLQRARFILRGPEVPLAYLITRLIEIKNIRIAQTVLRNNLAMSKAREMARDSYFGRR
jgi:V/A-type H+-transporting ATPase subunit C